MQVIPHRAPLLLVHLAADCLGLEAVWAVLPMPGNAQEWTGVVLKADRCSSLRQTACRFLEPSREKLFACFFLEQICFFEQMHEAEHGARRSLRRPDQPCSV